MTLDRLKTLTRTRGLSRREFIQQAMAAGITVASAQTLYSAMARAEPKKGGRFRLGLGSGSTSDTLDPGSIPDTFNQIVAWGALRSSLTDVTAEGKIVPDLAESFESSPDAKQWVFKLRKGVEFHNGKSLDADDVVASFKFHQGADSKSAAKPLLSDLTEVKADGKDTVIFTLANGNADFPFVTYDFHIPIMPAANGKVDWESGVGTGPYVKSSYEPGVRFEGRRFANYHGQTYFDEIEVLSIVDVAARMNALITGEVDFADRADLKTLPMLARNPGIAVLEIAGFAHYTAPMNCTVAPFNDKNVRLALKYAVDRKELVDKILLGHGTVGNDNPIAKGVPFYAEPKVQHSYDPDKVKFHLKAAGLQTLAVDLSTADAAFAGAVDAALLMKESAAKAGIDINVVREPNDGYWSNVWLKKPWCFSYWNGRPTPDAMFTTAYVTGAAWNESFWSNGTFDKTLAAARSELDAAKRAQMYAELQDLQAEDGGALVLMFNNLVNVHSDKLAHGAVAPNYDADGMKITQRWWFA
ncbi:MAG: ABC transporter substrate-binding protein [Alphaproteobacteria bacterium]|nr:MAG: ABC transporter substrate-binding protein [Alphaproteobacteria bacterium]